MSLQRRHLPDLRVLQTFEQSARHGNFTRAAEELALTQSAVSRQIRELEEQIGKPLFERAPGRVVLTRAGEDLLPEAQRLLRLAERALRHAGAGGAQETVLSINALPTFAARWLMPRLPGYLAQHPGLRIDLSTRKGVFDFDDSPCDLAIHYGQPNWPGGICSYLCSEIMVPVVGGAAAQPPSAPGELANLPRIHLSERPGLWPDWFAHHGVAVERAGEGHWVDQISLAIEAVKAGMGCALLPRYLIERELADGLLRVALDAPYSTEKAYYLVTPEGRSERVAAFRDWLIGEVSFRPLAD